MDIASIVGAVTGTVSLLAIIWFAGVWKGSMESSINTIKECQEKYPPAETSVMVKTLWDVYIVGGLQNRPDLASHKSPYKLHAATREMIPSEIRQTLDEKIKTSINGHLPCFGYQVVKTLGEPRLIRLSQEIGLTLQETISILVTYVSEDIPGAHSGMIC